MSATIYITTLALFLGTILLVFAAKYVSAAYSAHVRIRSDAAYRELTAKALALQTESSTTLSALRLDMVEVKTRLASLEQILKEVQ